MALKNTPGEYGLVHKTLHWVTALIVLALLSVGFWMSDLDYSPDKIQLYYLHKSFGLLVLFLALLRILWRFTNPIVQSLPSHKKWEKTLAHVVHFLIYAALVLMPLSGWLMSSAGDFPAPFFGLFEMPDLMPKNETAFKFLREFHEIFAYVIIGVVGLHAAGAFKHHFIDRDETLQRISSRRIGLIAGLVVAAVSGVLLLSPLIVVWKVENGAAEQVANAPEAAPAPEPEKAAFEGQWVVNPASSTIGFEATQYGEAFSGKFGSYTATIVFDPQNLPEAKALVSIDIASISTGSDDRDGQAKGAEWFDAARFPQAVFESESFAEAGPNQYLAKGKLTIRGVSLPIELPFSLKIEPGPEGKEIARVKAELSLNRLDFGVGQGQWQSAETIGNAVKVSISLEAARAGT